MIHQLRIYEIFEHNKAAFHDRFRDHAACAEQRIRRISRQRGIARALHHHVGKTIEGFDRLCGHQLAAENEAFGLPACIADDVIADTMGDAKMELIDRTPQHIGVGRGLAAARLAGGVPPAGPQA